MTVNKAGDAGKVNPIIPAKSKLVRPLPSTPNQSKSQAAPTSPPGPSPEAKRKALLYPAQLNNKQTTEVAPPVSTSVPEASPKIACQGLFPSAKLNQVQLGKVAAAKTQFHQEVDNLQVPLNEAQLKKALNTLNNTINDMTLKGSHSDVLHDPKVLESFKKLDQKLTSLFQTKGKEAVFANIIEQEGKTVLAALRSVSGTPIQAASLSHEPEKVSVSKKNNDIKNYILLLTTLSEHPSRRIFFANLSMLLIEKQIEEGTVDFNSRSSYTSAQEALEFARQGDIYNFVDVKLSAKTLLFIMDPVLYTPEQYELLKPSAKQFGEVLCANNLLEKIPLEDAPSIALSIALNSSIRLDQKFYIYEKSLTFKDSTLVKELEEHLANQAYGITLGALDNADDKIKMAAIGLLMKQIRPSGVQKDAVAHLNKTLSKTQVLENKAHLNKTLSKTQVLENNAGVKTTNKLF